MSSDRARMPSVVQQPPLRTEPAPIIRAVKQTALHIARNFPAHLKAIAAFAAPPNQRSLDQRMCPTTRHVPCVQVHHDPSSYPSLSTVRNWNLAAVSGLSLRSAVIQRGTKAPMNTPATRAPPHYPHQPCRPSQAEPWATAPSPRPSLGWAILHPPAPVVWPDHEPRHILPEGQRQL